MKQSIMGNNEAEEWLQKLKELPVYSVDSYIRTEDSRLTTGLYTIADELHTTMAAWHNLGTATKVKSLFSQIGEQIGSTPDRKGGWLRNLLLRFKDFIRDADESSAFPEETLQQLELAYQNTTIYQQRIQKLGEEHTGALNTYKAWIASLTHLDDSIGVMQLNVFRPGIIQRSVETISAQEQLAQIVMLQQQNLQRMATDVHHVAAIARSLAKNRMAAGQLWKQQYDRDLIQLRDYLGRRS